MKIVLQCSKCWAVSVDNWLNVEDDGTLAFGRMDKDEKGNRKWNTRPRCHNCKSDELIIGLAQLPVMNIP